MKKNKLFSYFNQSKLFVIILLLGILPFTFGQQKSIILGRPTNNSITASILFDQNVNYYLEYGTSSGVYNLSSAIYTNVLNVPDEIDLTNLQANTKYYYRMQYKTVGSSSYTPTTEYTFQTQRQPGSNFVFTVEADEHLYDHKGDATMYQITLANEAADHPDFMLSLGDTFGDDHTPLTTTDDDMNLLHKNYRQYLGAICNSIPFYVCLGNHEGENDYYMNINGIYTTTANPLPAAPNGIATWGTNWRKYYYPNPYPNSFYTGNTTVENYGIGLPENYYAWTWGDALFVVIDVYRNEIYPGTSPVDGSKPLNWEWTLGYTQYQWMRNVLETSTATHKFVFGHHTRGQGRGGLVTANGFEWGGNDGNQYKFDQYRPGWGKPIQQVFVDTGVDIFFQGHDHLYAKEVVNGVVYQETPMAADPTYTVGYTANASAYTDVKLDGTGHLRVSVTPDCVTVDYVKAYLPADTASGAHQNGEIGYSYTVGSCALNTTQQTIERKAYLYPNPANELLYIGFTDNSISHSYKLTNLTGQTILSFQTNELDTSNLPDGVYFIEIDGVKSMTQKLIIKH